MRTAPYTNNAIRAEGSSAKAFFWMGLGGFAREPKQPPSRKESVKSFPISSLRLTRMHTWILSIQDLGTSENAERVCSVLRDAVTLKKEFFQSHRS